MWEWLRRAYAIRWMAWDTVRAALARTAAAVGDRASADSARALRQRLALTADDLGPHERNSGLRRRRGETDRQQRLRLARAAGEMARQGQVADVRQRLDDLMGPGQWEIEEHPRESARVGDRIEAPARKCVGGPVLIVRTKTGAQRERIARADQSRCDGQDVCDGAPVPPTWDLSPLAEVLAPDIMLVDWDGIGVLQ